MAEVIYTNVSTYRAIAIEAFEAMRELVGSGRRPKEDGAPGWILQFDPNQKSFKQAMVVIVFTGTTWPIRASLFAFLVAGSWKRISAGFALSCWPGRDAGCTRRRATTRA